MNYGVILASCGGNRVKSIDIPKQYYEIEGIPIFIYTLKRMLESNLFDVIYIAIKEEYLDKVSNYIKKFISDDSKIKIVFGGKERIDTIHNVISEISKNEINDDDVIVIHDAVRPFVTDKILSDSIHYSRIYGATVAAVPASDTMLISSDGERVESIPKRSLLYKGQAPDSFNLKTFIELENKLTDEQKALITGTSQICTMNNYPIRMIPGDEINFKITTDSDLEIVRDIIINSKEGRSNE